MEADNIGNSFCKDCHGYPEQTTFRSPLIQSYSIPTAPNRYKMNRTSDFLCLFDVPSVVIPSMGLFQILQVEKPAGSGPQGADKGIRSEFNWRCLDR